VGNHLEAERKREEIIARCKVARANLLKPQLINEEAWNQAFGDGGFSLEDGWARIFALSKFGVLHVYRRLRLQEDWLQALSLDVKTFKELTRWPQGNLPKSNPWKVLYFQRNVVSAPIWNKEHQQWEVKFDCRPSLTFFFKDEFLAAPTLAGWVIPRKQHSTFPWKEVHGVIKEPRRTKAYAPDLDNEEIQMLIDGNRAEVMRRLLRRNERELEEKSICVMDIKASVDALVKSLNE